MATSRDIQEVISKLSSDKAKSRDEGIKLLNSWLEGERSIGFCRLLARNTARMKPDEIPHAETWPFIVTLLTKCIVVEISTSKKRPPKLILAKTLRTCIQCAEDMKLSGKPLLLFSVVKQLFNHIWEVTKDVSCFQSEYSSILRHLLAAREYRYQIRRRVYCNLVLLYMNKVHVGMKANSQSHSKEEIYRCILTLHILLDNPPGDFPDNIREDLVQEFCGIFSYVRDEGKVSRKLMECINTYLLRDGQNLGCQAMKIHSALREFMLRFWLTTHDRVLKSSFILYARVQVKICRDTSEGCSLLEQLFDIIVKELDQNSISCTGILRTDSSRDDKSGNKGGIQQGLWELAAAVFYRACKDTAKRSHEVKRLKIDPPAARIRDGIVKSSWLWNGAFCLLIHNYSSRLDLSLLIYWFEGICESLQRMLNNSSTMHSYDGLLWLLRVLQELSFVLVHSTFDGISQCSSLSSNEALLVKNCWNAIWSSLLHGLPIFSNIAPVAGVTLELLGNMILRDQTGIAVVPPDIWDLRIFKHMPSSPALYFIACYFSWQGAQGDLRDVLYLRRRLLKAVLELIKGQSCFSVQGTMLIPAAVFSLSTGCPSILPSFCGISMHLDANEALVKLPMEECDRGTLDEVLECSAENLADIDVKTSHEVKAKHHAGIWLPRQIKQPLTEEMVEFISGLVTANGEVWEPKNIVFSDIINMCSLLSNCIYCSLLSRLREVKLFPYNPIFDYISGLLELAVSLIDKSCHEIQSGDFSGLNTVLDPSGSALCSLQNFLSCPLLGRWKEKEGFDSDLLGGVVRTIGKLLRAFAKLFYVLSSTVHNHDVGIDEQVVGLMPSISETSSVAEGKMQIVDVELDINDDSKDVDTYIACGSRSSVVFCSPFQLKLEIVSAVSLFFSALPDVTWDVLLDLMEKANDSKVCQKILFSLFKCFPGSGGSFSALVTSANCILLDGVSPKHCCFNILNAIHALLGSLTAMGYSRKIVNAQQCMEVSEENLNTLVDLVNKVAEIGLPDFSARIKLIDCICSFVLLNPHAAQAMIEKLLSMLQDPDYRVRISLARKINVLLQTWDGHDELFDDICSNFGFEMVRASKEKLVKAGQVLASGLPCGLLIETALVTLEHLAVSSEKVEIEAVFMICTVAAVVPPQRKLAYSILEILSRKLQYPSRAKYINELAGSILTRWAACEVSLVALVEVQDLFLTKCEANQFIIYCSPWLLPHLILRGDMQSLNWVSTVACQPLPDLVKDFFVPIFAVCMAVHCSKKPDSENGGKALRDSILHIAKISDLERDCLIKKHMVSIVSYLLSLTSFSETSLPFFSKDTIVLSVQTIVDGFLDMDNHVGEFCIIDRMNIFRSDRVFKFLIEMHYQIAAAIHPWHKCHRLSALGVLVRIIGCRAAVPSTSNYIINILGQFIGSQSLQEQCCNILSDLLKAFNSSSSKESVSILGEQLQFLVSKLVACCIPDENQGDESALCSPSVISLVHQLTLDADPSLHDYIRELEPFPEIKCLNRVRTFHEDLCKNYSPKDHFLKFVRRNSYLPQGLFLWSFRNLHKKLLKGEIIEREINGESRWKCDPEIVAAVWTLVDICDSNAANDMCNMLADFISRVGIGDPYQVVFQLPKHSNHKSLLHPNSCDTHDEVASYMDAVVSEELLTILLRLLKKYLLDSSVKTVDITSSTLQGILSTERGQSALLSLGSYEKSLIEVHSRGSNLELVEKLLLDADGSCYEDTSLDDSSLWSTTGKTYDMWVCSLVHSLLGHCNDIILRLCRDIVMLKAEVAEILFASVLMDLAGRIDSNIDMCELISIKVLENIFVESNDLFRSIQVLLNALSRIRSFYFKDKSGASSTPLKHGKPCSYSKTRCPSDKIVRPSNVLLSCSLWKKVYWLSVDYLVVARAAIRCGSYFTAVMYVEHWCEEHFNSLSLGFPDFSHLQLQPLHIELLVAAFTKINEPDSIYGVIRSHKLTSQIITYEHEGNWGKALEYYDLFVRLEMMRQNNGLSGKEPGNDLESLSSYRNIEKMPNWAAYKGLMRSLQKTGCTHVLDVYCQGLTSQKGHLQHDLEFTELQYEAAWRAGNWDFSLLAPAVNSPHSMQCIWTNHFNEDLHCCLRALQEGDDNDFRMKLVFSKKEVLLSISEASKESTEYVYSAILKLQILDNLGMAWNLRWKHLNPQQRSFVVPDKTFPQPIIPTELQLESLNREWSIILKQVELHLNLLEPFIAFRHVLLQILNCNECTTEHLLQSASILRKGARFSLAAASLHELKLLSGQPENQVASHTYFLGRLEEAKVLRAQGQHEMAISLGNYILQNCQMNQEASNVYRLVGKWLAEARSSNSRTILEHYLKKSVELTKSDTSSEKYTSRQCKTYFYLAHYTDGLFKSYEERLASSEWQAALRLRKHKTRELEALIKRLKGSSKGEKTDYSVKIQELQKQLMMDREEAEKLQDDRDNFLSIALEGYQRCLVIGGKHDLQVVFRLVSLWFSLYSRQSVVKAMLNTVKEVQSYKFIPLVYQIASRLGGSKDGQGSSSFQKALVSLVRKMAIDHPYHTMFQLLALANGDRIKDKQRSRNSFVVDMDKKLAAENLLKELSSVHGAILQQMRQMVEIYIKLAELETKKEEMNKKLTLPRDIRSVRQLELVPVITATVTVDPSCQYREGSFPYFKGLADSIIVMNGINAPKVVECFGSDGRKYRQLAKSGNDDLRQDAVMEQFFGLVNTFLQSHRDTWKRRLGIRTYKVVPFTPSAGVLEWVDRTIPLGEYLLGSMRNGGAHGRYGLGDWSFLQCREHMTKEKDKREAYAEVCDNFRPVMHYFFLERFLQPADWFEKRLTYTRSVAASSMVGYIVGLGDRHSMNILIDQATAEVIHIDLGVAFEQGLMLKTPERVPFRLTRDIIDGMGVTGVEGVFRRCSEETLSVMRTNKEALLTIIEVFIHDPLYKWALSPLKALQRQKETDDDTDSSLESSQDAYEGNKDAARALLRVKQKLDGYEEGEMRSVEGQVQQLIQDATDADRLCQMFPGWGAWL